MAARAHPRRMEPLSLDSARSLARSRHRLRLLLAISSLGEAYLNQLAKHTGLSATRVRWLLYGRPPYYREDLSLVGLGLVREVNGARGRSFAITPRGRRKARSVAAAWARRGSRKGPEAR